MMAKKHTLESLRKKIDEIDTLLIDTISERARCAKQVAEVKQDQGDQTYYKPEREAQVLRRVMEKNQGPLGNEDMARHILVTKRTLIFFHNTT